MHMSPFPLNKIILINLLLLSTTSLCAKFYDNPLKGQLSCEYSQLSSVHIAWPKNISSEKLGLTSNIIVYQPSQLYGVKNSQEWYKSTSGSTMLQDEDEKIRFNWNADTVDILNTASTESETFDTFSFSDTSRVLAYYPSVYGPSSRLMEIKLPHPGFYCVHIKYMLSPQGQYELPYTLYDETSRKTIRLLKLYTPENRDMKSDLEFMTTIAASHLPQVRFYDSQYRAIYVDTFCTTRWILLSRYIWPTCLLVLLIRLSVAKSDEVKKRLEFSIELGIFATISWLVRWIIAALRFNLNEIGIPSGEDALRAYSEVFVFYLFISVFLYFLSFIREQEIDPEKRFDMLYLIPSAVLMWIFRDLPSWFLFTSYLPIFGSAVVIGQDGRTFQLTNLILMWIGTCGVFLPVVITIQCMVLGLSNEELKSTYGCVYPSQTKAFRSLILHCRLMSVIGFCYIAFLFDYTYKTRTQTSIAALDYLPELTLHSILYNHVDLIAILATLWTGLLTLGYMFLIPTLPNRKYVPLTDLKVGSVVTGN